MPNVGAGIGAQTLYHFSCFGPDGILKWEEKFPNLVVNDGLSDILRAMFITPRANTDWFVGLKGVGTISSNDILSAHPGWTELTSYSGSRPAFNEGPLFISTGQVLLTNSASLAVFNITGTITVAGAFLTSAATGTSGDLYGVGDLVDGARNLKSGDVLHVQIDLRTLAV